MSDYTKTITIPVSMGDWENDFRDLVMDGLEFQWTFPITTTGELVLLNFVQEDEEEES